MVLDFSPLEFDELQKDALAEAGTISLGSAATALSQLVNKEVRITAPMVTLTSMEKVRSNYPIPCLVVAVNYIEGLKGENVLVIKKEDALLIVGLMMGLESPEKPLDLGEMELSAIGEAMNQMMGSASTAMSDFLNRPIAISPPQVDHKDFNIEGFDTDNIQDDTILAQVSFRMEIENIMDSQILQLLPLPFAREMTNFMLASLAGEQVAGEAKEKKAEVTVGEKIVSPQEPLKREYRERQPEKGAASLQDTVYQGAKPKTMNPYHAKLDLIRDLPVEIFAVLGKTKIMLQDAFALHTGDIVSLDRYLGEPVELFANDRLIAKGEVVLINGQFGIKITDILRRNKNYEKR